MKKEVVVIVSAGMMPLGILNINYPPEYTSFNNSHKKKAHSKIWKMWI